MECPRCGSKLVGTIGGDVVKKIYVYQCPECGRIFTTGEEAE